ncbi:MAG: hypothetical protein DCC64_09185 [Planctomycetota bacterium]|nr:MAG: hypothetical protein DCC64_09185 [Planctomycetota bacterium]
MDTLVIVRKIREAEALADSGKHGDARSLLEPLLARPDLPASHKSLLQKKIEVFEKQRERATRIISRRVAGLAASRPDGNDTDHGAAAGRESSNDTTVERPAIVPGSPTESVPRPPVEDKIDKDTTKLRKRPPPEKPGGDTTLADRDLISLYDSPGGDTTVRDRPAVAPDAKGDTEPSLPRQADTDVPGRAPRRAGRTLEPRVGVLSDLAPLEASPSVMEDDTAEIPKVDVSLPVLVARPSRESRELAPVGDEKFESDEVPQPDGEERGMFRAVSTPTPQALPALPQSDTVRDRPAAASVRVQDSIIEVPGPAAPAGVPEARPSTRTSKDLTSLVERLPDDDLRKELALEVVRLREELEKARSTRRDTDKSASAGSSRRIAPGDKPESSIFKIPSNRVNTIVRTAAGTSEITAHMPTRDENVPELQVLRRDSVKRGNEDSGRMPASRVALAQDYIDAAQVEKPNVLRTAAVVLGFLVVAGLVSWAVYWGVAAALAAAPAESQGNGERP